MAVHAQPRLALGVEEGHSLRNLLEGIRFLEDSWYLVGETLGVPEDTLRALQASPQANDHRKNLEIVVSHWKEKNLNLLWVKLVKRLCANEEILQRYPDRLTELKNAYNNICVDTETEPHHESTHSECPSEENVNIPTDSKSCFRKCLPSRLPLRPIVKSSFHFLVVAVGVYMLLIAGYGPEKLDELDRILQEDEKAADRLLEVGVRQIRILVTGKTGTGKSALINGLIGDNVTEEGSSLDPTTTEVEQFKRIVRGVPMLVFDSPGLQDGTENEKAYLLDMEKKCKKVDLVLYTIKMTDKRLHPEDVEAMKKLTNAFGAKFWESAMFVMTFANEVRNPEKPDEEEENMIFFGERLVQWKEKLPKTLKKELNVSTEVATGVPVVPAGYYKNIHLPGRRYWFSQFWTSALERMKEFSDEGYSFMLRFNKDRFRRAYELTPEELKKDLHKQPIVVVNGTSRTAADEPLRAPASALPTAQNTIAYTAVSFFLTAFVIFIVL